MILLALGLATLALLLWAARSFSRADVGSVKSLLAWVAALGGLVLATMLLLTGRGAMALGGAVLLGPLVWGWWREAQVTRQPSGQRTPRSSSSRMSRAEALGVLGLTDPASDSDVRAAWVRLMRIAHPDGGGSDWLAARVNQAKDVLLGKR